MASETISTTYPVEGQTANLTFTRCSKEVGALVAEAAPEAVTKLIACEDQLFDWLEQSEDNARRFASDPVAALKAAVPDLGSLIDELRAEVSAVAPEAKSVPVETHTPMQVFADATNTPAPFADAMLLTATSTAMNGWDMIVATRQGLINSGLQKLYTSETVRTTVNAGGFIGQLAIDVTIGPPSVDTLEGGGRLARATLPLLGGTIRRLADGHTISVKGTNLMITSNLLALEATAQPQPGEGRNYDVFIDLRSAEAVFDAQLPGTNDPVGMALLILAMKTYLQSLAGQKYRIARINLGRNVPRAVEPLIPQVADFTFINHPSKPDETTFAALLLNDLNKPRGNFFFNSSMIPDNVKSVGMISNEIFIREMVFPALKDAIAKKARGGGERHLFPQRLADDAWRITNGANIYLNQDKDPWIENGSLHCRVDGDKLRLQLEVRARVTFMSILVKIRAFVGWQVRVTTVGNEQRIDLVQVEYREEKDSSMEWWKWLIAVMTGAIGVIVASIVRGIVSLSIPSLPSNIFAIPMESIRWPYYEHLSLDAVNLPSPVVVQGTPKFLEG